MTGPVAASALARRFESVRAATERLAAPLTAEDQTPQSMPDASPVKWHRAHTTWFFETFVLEKAIAGYVAFDPAYRVLFNSYYNTVGEQYTRADRGLLSRPGIAEVAAYRAHVDGLMRDLLAHDRLGEDALAVVELGLHHEEQHQELLVTDVKHLLSRNPTHPVYRARAGGAGNPAPPAPVRRWLPVEGGLREIGHAGPGFHFDNEAPRHTVHLGGFELAMRLSTNGEWIEFMEDGGYARPELWLADGWATAQERGWQAPLYWLERDGVWHQFTLSGLLPVDPHEPVTHVSAYEADAFAAWAGARLATEAEWETVAGAAPAAGHFADRERFHPAAAAVSGGVDQLFGDVWEWTRSAYAPYPGFRIAEGALGEYNGKFMANQWVLRGGSCATPPAHIRPTYRNFFYPDARWQFSGVRLARDRH